MSEWVKDVTDSTFDAEVVERSRTTPVVVDFWAPWCGPCRTLGPVLERLVGQHRGEVILAKVNVDENPRVAQGFGIRGIPAVKAFRDGVLVDEFVGAVPEEVVRAFVAGLLPTEADRLHEKAARAEAQSDPSGAEGLYRRALEIDVNHPAARLGLAKLVAGRDREAALRELERVLPGTPERAEADRIAARLRIVEQETDGGADLERRVSENPNDLDARLRLAKLLAAREEWEAALRHFLEVVRRDREYEDQAARKAMLDVFEVLGPRHALTEKYRAELARVLYS